MNRRITIRVNPPTRQKLEQLVQEGKFKNISNVVRQALEHFLSKEAD